MSSAIHQAARIMVIDDEPDNLNVLDGLLKYEDFIVSFFTAGDDALAAAYAQPPDLILLDVLMPGIDGFALCQLFKESPQLAEIPILFISGMSDVDIIRKGFELGAVDYITKPFRGAEILARIRTHLALSRARKQLESQYLSLQDLERERDIAVHMLVHDMRSPLQVILSNLEIMRRKEKVFSEQFDQESVNSAIICTRALSRMISNLLDLRHLQSKQINLHLEETAISDLINDAYVQVWDPASQRKLLTQIDPHCLPVQCDREMSVRTLANLLSNAVKYSPSCSTVTVLAIPNGTECRIEVRDQGPGIAPEDRESIFRYLETLPEADSRKCRSYGIGLAFCKSAVEMQGGSIGIESKLGSGSTFWFTLPFLEKKIVH